MEVRTKKYKYVHYKHDKNDVYVVEHLTDDNQIIERKILQCDGYDIDDKHQACQGPYTSRRASQLKKKLAQMEQDKKNDNYDNNKVDDDYNYDTRFVRRRKW